MLLNYRWSEVFCICVINYKRFNNNSRGSRATVRTRQTFQDKIDTTIKEFRSEMLREKIRAIKITNSN